MDSGLAGQLGGGVVQHVTMVCLREHAPAPIQYQLMEVTRVQEMIQIQGFAIYAHVQVMCNINTLISDNGFHFI